MIYWLGQVCKQERLRSRLNQSAVAGKLNVDQTTVTRFEKGESWPKQPDKIIAAYADVTDIDARDLWQRAIDLWRQHGEAPALS